MAIIQCKRLHYYDNERFSECPHCAQSAQKGGVEEDSVTVAMEAQQVENYAVEYIRKNATAQKQRINVNPVVARETPSWQAQQGMPAMPYGDANKAGVPFMPKDEEKTISIYEKKGISRCTAGWLVCIQGEEYGRDFPLYAGFNRIGRSHSNDIVLRDPQISREEHCSLIYEEKKNVFYVLPCAGNLTYLDDELIDQAQQVESGKILALGETQLEFVAFCTGEKRWEKKE